jgi:cysteine protease ATG4
VYEVMADSEIARYGRKVMQLFNFREPRNDNAGVPIFLLGVRYDNQLPPPARAVTSSPETPVMVAHVIPSPSDSPLSMSKSNENASDFEEITSSQVPPQDDGEDEPVSQSQPESQNPKQEGVSWPQEFLEDFGSLPWFTYRSNFPLIPRSHDPKAVAGMSFGVRISQMVSREDGFGSDTGWGCMIRSGQSLLAETVLRIQLGRGWSSLP